MAPFNYARGLIIQKNNKLIYNLFHSCIPTIRTKNSSLWTLFILFSFLLVASAQPDWSVVSCLAASSIGYALFWLACVRIRSRKACFALASTWFACLTAIHLNWFFSDRYVGVYIYIVVALLAIIFGLQFGWISLWIARLKTLSIWTILGICSAWILCEWSRLLIFTGYTFDPAGLALTATIAGMQMASLFGIYGLSFWVMLTNLFALKLFTTPTKKNGVLWLLVLATPYFFGWVQLYVHSPRIAKESPVLSALLVQPALTPEQKMPLQGSTPYTLFQQWGLALELLAPYASSSPDLIVFPEAFVPYGTYWNLYPIPMVHQTFNQFFPVREMLSSESEIKVGHDFWAQALATIMKSEVIMGLEDGDLHEGRLTVYNAAFLFKPNSQQKSRYEKRILVPMGEYIPFQWCKKILSKYGISDSYTAGKRATLFQIHRALAAISICYEETFGYLMRQMVEQGATLHINLTNDVWYPRSRLPIVHFLHGRVRAVEGGIPCLRACNTGVTCGIDALGRIVGVLPYENREKNAPAGVLSLRLPLYHYKTFYVLWGDAPLICLSSLMLAGCFVQRLRKKSNVNDLANCPCEKTQI